ncbi:hypothetical protein, partial [Rhizobium ecuadorense]|uniref:hypothetical protein n=1 Tax=Rhizobium ecuadorense TaxID=1671795 RepID=UPI001AEC2D4A
LVCCEKSSYEGTKIVVLSIIDTHLVSKLAFCIRTAIGNRTQKLRVKIIGALGVRELYAGQIQPNVIVASAEIVDANPGKAGQKDEQYKN